MKTNKIIKTAESLEPLFEQFILGSNIIGASVSIVTDKEILYTKNYGRKSMDSNEAPDENTLFMIGSCSKSYAAFAIMQLIQQGKISLDDPINKYLPCTLGESENPILIKHILSHTSGIPNLGMSETLIKKQLGGEYIDAFETVDNFFSHLNKADTELVLKPGEKYVYINTGFTLAAEIVKNVTGMPYEEYVKEYIFRPLDMNRSIYLEEDFQTLDNVASHYNSKGDEKSVYFEPVIAGCGGIISCVADQTKYLQMLLGKGTLNGTRVLDSHYVDMLGKTFVNHNTGNSLFGEGFGPEGYGFGWMTYDDFNGTKVITHSGSTGLSSANLFFVPEFNFGISFVCNNSVGESIFPILGFMLTAALKGIDPMGVFSYFSLEAKLANLQGLYTGYKDIVKRKITYENGLLWLQSADENDNSSELKLPLIPLDDTLEQLKFKLYAGPSAYMVLEFKYDSSDNIYLFVERNLLHKRN